MNLANLFGSIVDVTIAGIILGAGLPALFALGIRFAFGTTTVHPDGTTTHSATAVGKVLAWICFAIIAAAIIFGILWITKSTMHQYFNIDIFGTEA